MDGLIKIRQTSDLAIEPEWILPNLYGQRHDIFAPCGCPRQGRGRATGPGARAQRKGHLARTWRAGLQVRNIVRVSLDESGALPENWPNVTIAQGSRGQRPVFAPC